MSVKFDQREQVRAAVDSGKREDLAHRVGDALTKAGEPQGYLAVSINRLLSGRSNPGRHADSRHVAQHPLTLYRHTSSSSNPTLFAPRC